MKLLVYPHDLAIGGSQINAIDLAAAVASAGHEVIIYGIPGPLLSYVEEKGLRFIAARRLRYRPAPSRIVQLARIARRERLDLIHAYEWPPCLDAYFGARWSAGVPVLATILGMTLMPFVPSSVPMIMGTAELGALARQQHNGPVWVIEPPIDTVRDHPGIDGSAFRASLRVADDELLVVTVSRLAIDLKLDALVRAVDAADELAQRYRLRLVLVGDGPARSALQSRAEAVNLRRGREVVTLVGARLDPRDAYAAADVVVGMGSSALRALAIGRPVVVQGEEGFSSVFEQATLPLFLHQGFYGRGQPATDTRSLAQQLDCLLSNPERRNALGRFGRSTVVERFGLERAVKLQLDIYDSVLRNPVRFSVRNSLRSAMQASILEVQNHDPRRKALQQRTERVLLETAKGGVWPRPMTGA